MHTDVCVGSGTSQRVMRLAARAMMATAMLSLMAASMLAIADLAAGHRSPVIDQPGQRSVLAFQRHSVNRVNQQAVKASTESTVSNHVGKDDRILQTKAKGARARVCSLDNAERWGGTGARSQQVDGCEGSGSRATRRPNFMRKFRPRGSDFDQNFPKRKMPRKA